MRLHPAFSLLITLVLLVAGSLTSPLAYPSGKLEEINALRARGVPEVRFRTHVPHKQRLLNADRQQ